LIQSDIESLLDEAARLGVVLSDEDVAAAAELGDAIDRIRITAEAAIVRIGAAVAGPVTQIADVVSSVFSWVSQWEEKNREVLATVMAIGVGVTVVGAVIAGIGIMLLGVGAAFAAVSAVMGALAMVFTTKIGILVLIFAALGATAYSFREQLVAMIPNTHLLHQAFAKAHEVWDAFVNAVTAGDIQAAFRLMSAAVSVVWTQTMKLLESAFGSTRDLILNTWTIASSNIAQTGVTAFNALANAWDAMATGMRLAIVNAISIASRLVIELVSRLQTAILTAEQLATGKNNAVAIIKAEAARVYGHQQLEDQRQAAVTDISTGLMQRKGERDFEAEQQRRMIEENANTQVDERLRATQAYREKLDADLAAARQELDAAIVVANASKPKPFAKKPTPDGINDAESALDALKQTETALPRQDSRGTFTAAAAFAFGGGANNAQEATAQNTKRLVKIAEAEAKKPKGNLVFGV
jgi:hypothetical protein